VQRKSRDGIRLLTLRAVCRRGFDIGKKRLIYSIALQKSFPRSALMSRRSLLIPTMLLMITTFVASQKVHQPTLTPQDSDTTESLIAVSPVNPQVVGQAAATEHLPRPPTAGKPGTRALCPVQRRCSSAMWKV
jgi:hypothetical protein